MTIWIVYLTDDYEAWSVVAMFAKEADAVACAATLTEVSKARWADFCAEEGYHEPYYNVYVAESAQVFASLLDWQTAQEKNDHLARTHLATSDRTC